MNELEKELRRQIKELQEQNYQLRRENDELKNKPFYQIARERGISYKIDDRDI